MTSDVAILVVGSEPVAGELAADVRGLVPEFVRVEIADDVDAALAIARQVPAPGIVPLAFVEFDDDAERGVEKLMALHADDDLATTRFVLVSSRVSLRGVDEALNQGAIHGMITRPWTESGLRRMLEAHLATYLVEHAPDRLTAFDGLLDAEDREQAEARVEQRRVSTERRTEETAHPILDDSVDEHALESELVRLLDRALGHLPRIRVGPGTVLIEAGEDVGGIYVVLEGVVVLVSRTERGERVLHEASTGPIVGLLSLASHRRAMLESRVVTEVRAMPVTIDQLDQALDAEPGLSGLLMRVLIRSLARRLRRSDELQVELDESLAALSEARAQLVASARFTTLGEISAGMAHELNNPSAALVRAVDHLVDDLAVVIDDPTTEAAIRRGLEATPLSTADRRAARRMLADELGDRRLAERLVDLGITDVAEGRAVGRLDAASVDRIEAAVRLGQTIRNTASAAERIRSLVGSLRAYARGEDGRGPLVPDVDVAEGLDDALRLVSHRLAEVDVDRHYGEVATITARPGELQQVWTNLISNALDAIDDRGRLTVRVMSFGGGVRVEIVDDGPGVPADLVSRIFEPRFTTKGGRVEFGLGLGLSISRQIVEEHRGTIGVESRPGRTVFSVELPVGGAS